MEQQNVGKKCEFESITKDKFMEYVKRRKSLVKDFPKEFENKYMENCEKYESQKNKQKEIYSEKIKNDADFKDKMKAKSKAQYSAKKAKKLETIIENISSSSESEEECPTIKIEPKKSDFFGSRFLGLV